MNNITKKTLSAFSSVAVVLSSFAIIALATPVLAATVTIIGNDTTSRTQVDTASNFTVIDMNHPATSSGQITSFGYFASNLNPFNFVLVDGSNVVQYVSPVVTPTAIGANTFTPTSPVSIQTGWNVGLYFSSTGTVPFENTGAPASFTASGSGMPTTGSTLAFSGSVSRTYSVTALGTVTIVPVLTTVTVSPTTETLIVGGTQQLTVSPMDQNSTAFVGATLSYVSSNPAVATVSTSGLVTAFSAGTTTITATATSGSTIVTATSAVTVNNVVTPPTGTAVVGNDVTARTQLDLASNFTVVDMNHPATSAGQVNSFGYYAVNMNPFNFVLVNSSNIVQWVSPVITPTVVGMNTFTPSFPLAIQAGWNLGAYFSSTGTIPYEATGASAMWTNVNSGMPSATMLLNIIGSGSRTYSFVAYGTTTTVITPVLTSITVTPITETLDIGGTQQLTPSPMDQNSVAFSGATLSYTSSDTSVATVSTSGLVTGVSTGVATITVTATSGSTSVSTTSVVSVNQGGQGGGDQGDHGNHGHNPSDNLRISILLNMIKRLLAQLGITQTFTSNGMTF